ncbi:MAG TPA: ABC transporter permease subunit [Candidatus Binatia bacterium]|jgi:phosphate transport system permease protein|nr:ABC transporter permease subunit [Candidatus Binatia bacterium]
MPEIQEIEELQPEARKAQVRLYAAEKKSRARGKKLADRVARVIITAGGIAIILSIVAILFIIVAETLPLWRSPAAQSEPGMSLQLTPREGDGRPMAVGVEEYRTIVYVMTAAGTVDFFSLADSHLLQRYEIKALAGQRPTAAYRDGIHHTIAVGTADGVVVPLKFNFSVRFKDGKRTLTPEVKEGQPLQVDPEGRPITALVYEEDEGKTAAAALVGPRRLLFFAQREKTSLLDSSGVDEYRADLSAALTADVTALALDRFQSNLLAGTSSGAVYHWQVDEPDSPTLVDTFLPGQTSDVGITALAWLLGDRSIVVGDTAGGVSVWFQVRDPQNPQIAPYRQIHVLRSHSAPVTAIAPSPRDKGFLTADAKGTVLLHHATSEQTLLELQTGGNALEALTFAPKADGVLTTDTQGRLFRWYLYNPHPEINLKTLFGKVWYEGYAEPDYTWQSSSGSDDFEAKFSLTPLAYGTLKGTFYALLFAVPLSICAAIYTSQFMHPSLRNIIKPTVEVMAALPSVVLGFFAGLWLAPRVEKLVPAVLLLLVALPVVTLAASFLWRLIPLSVRNRFKPGVELAFLGPLLLLTAYVCVSVNGQIEAALFHGSFPQWLYDTTGVRYDPRNSLVVGFAMGFAVIPLIYTISEDALSNVPQHLISGSLALGATRWQTAVRVVLPTASPGLFSAVMIGFGRAVGETMIVLMATGNTPVMDFSPFDGFRALSANIAVEIPEAPYGGTLYRVLFLAALLLFVMTFLVNTAAELVRQRLRERYSRI